jgi:sulfur-carrier protein adenylyltransferase/sulfurtransferase
MINQITVTDLKGKLDRGEDFLLLDVREQKEYDIARIPGSTLVPLSVIQQRVSELEDMKDREIVIHCKLGGRSMQACQFLESLGFKNLVNLTGGITAWSEQVDPGVAKY